MKLTSSEQLTAKQILDFILYMKSTDSGIDDEAQNTIELIKSVASPDNDRITARLGEITALAAMGAILHDSHPGIACWVVGFMMGVKFSNKEVVDSGLATLMGGENDNKA